MKTRCFRSGWLIPAFGIGLVAGVILSSTIYHRLERQADEEIAYVSVLERLCQDYKLSLVLKMMHEGKIDDAEQRLDLLLCWDVLRADVELGPADACTRAWTENVLRMIAQARPKLAGNGAGSTVQLVGAREEAERVLERVLKEGSPQR